MKIGLTDKDEAKGEYGTFLDKKAKGGKKEFTKSELDLFILEHSGSMVNDFVLDNIFLECDKDKSGTVTHQELLEYFQDIQKQQKEQGAHDRIKYILYRTLFHSRPFWPALLFVSSGCYLITLNILGRFIQLSKDIPLVGFGLLAFAIGAYVFVAIQFEAVARQVKLFDRVNRKIIRWASNKNTTKTEDDDENRGMTMIELDQELRADSIYLPCVSLERVFSKIDKDKSKRITMAEIKDYAANNIDVRNTMTTGPTKFYFRVLSQCFVTFSYWLSWGWLVGYMLLSIPQFHIVSDWAAKVATRHDLTGIGGIVLLVAAIGQYQGQYKAATEKVELIHEREETLAISVERIRQSLQDKQLQQQQKQQKTYDDNLDDSIVLNNESTTEFAAVTLFQSLDDSGLETAHDNKLDFCEFHDALTRMGFVTPLPVEKAIFKRVDTSNDGSIDVEEFVRHVEQSSRPESWWDRLKLVLVTMRSEVIFWIALGKLLGSICFVIRSYGTSSKIVFKNLTLLGGSCFVCAGVTCIYMMFKRRAIEYDTLWYSKVEFAKTFQKVYRAKLMTNNDGAEMV